jgi:hypothetical protein
MAIRATPNRLNVSMALVVSSRVALGLNVCSQAQHHSVANERVEVLSLKWIAAGENEKRIAEGPDAFQQPVSLGRREFMRVPVGQRRSPAVDARQVTGLGDFPDYK